MYFTMYLYRGGLQIVVSCMLGPSVPNKLEKPIDYMYMYRVRKIESIELNDRLTGRSNRSMATMVQRLIICIRP